MRAMASPIHDAVREPDGSTTEYADVPVAGDRVERLMTEVFGQHWAAITAGPVIDGAAYEIRFTAAPRLSMLDGYLTIDTGPWHFHLCVNDHLVFSRPWLDGPTALAAVLPRSGRMTLATTVAVPVLRGPAATAKILAAIDLLSGGRLVAGLGPGSSARDYELVGVRFEERWKRLDEAVQALRAYWRADDLAFEGAYYSTAGFTLTPTPAERPGPPIWIGSWGSAAGLRRVARLADGWLASGYNTTPELFAQAWLNVQAEVTFRPGRLLAGEEVELEPFPGAEPDQLPRVQRARDRQLNQTEHLAIEAPDAALPTLGYRRRHVLQPSDRYVSHPVHSAMSAGSMGGSGGPATWGARLTSASSCSGRLSSSPSAQTSVMRSSAGSTFEVCWNQ